MYNLKEKLILASGSPRRKEMLSQAGINFEVIVSDVEELVLPTETPEQMVIRLALLKGREVAKQNSERWVLSADTTVVIDDEILNKPADKDDSIRMLTRLQGRSHRVWGGIALTNNCKGIAHSISVCSVVYMKKLSPSQVLSYIASGECHDKAGSYAIQGVGASLIEKIEGSYTNVVGMDLCSVVKAFEEFGLV